ncbi:MAG: septum formation initiator family protein [Deltaproteobacteria bacterium]|nr:septum formation initiator family protein [Deltaproteobacteria bacterium]
MRFPPSLIRFLFRRGIPRPEDLWVWLLAWKNWQLAADRNFRRKDALTRSFLVFALLFGAGVILTGVFGDQGLLAWMGLREERSRLVERLKGLEERRQVLESQIDALKHDPAYIRFLARRDLGLVSPGEVVVIRAENP